MEKQNTWWKSFPQIESRNICPIPFGEPPIFKTGDIVILKEKPEKRRKVLKVEWHRHRYQWTYIIETSATSSNPYFEPYWFKDKLSLDTPK